MNHLTAEQVQGQDGEEGKPGSEDRPAEGLIDAAINEREDVLSLVEADVLTNPVEDHNRVIHRIAHQGQQRRNYGQSDFLVEQGKNTERYENVMKRRDDRSDAVD